MERANFKKVIRIGHCSDGDIFCQIEFENGCLSISGVIGPMRNGDCRGSAGQINMSLEEMPYQSIDFALGWNVALFLKFLNVWERWHLNDMRAGCEHQRYMNWHKLPIDPEKPLNAYGKFFNGQQHDSYNMLVWVRPNEHPRGLLGVECPTCGYKYGSRWLKEEVPVDVIDFLQGLPDTDKHPAWV